MNIHQNSQNTDDLSTPQFSHLEQAVSSLFGNKIIISHRTKLAGGDIGTTYLLQTADSQEFILKKYHGKNSHAMCKAEAYGLKLIENTQTIKVPFVYAIIVPNSDLANTLDNTIETSLLMSYLHPITPQGTFWERFGHALATMHNTQSQLQDFTHHFGLDKTNFIGRTPQPNDKHSSWIEFFFKKRIWQQCLLAFKLSYFTEKEMKIMEQFCKKLPDLLIEPQYPSLLHGDLWEGNYLCCNNQPVLIDPAVYYGHYEVDLAMTELFGGYSPRFYHAYSEINQLNKDYQERKKIYNLYHLLNHLNLFGNSYYNSVMQIVKRYI